MPIFLTPKTIRFRGGRAPSKPALALVADLAGFSAFANGPDAAQWVPRYFNHVSEALQTVIYGGDPYWLGDEDAEYARLSKPSHQKFLGDGALYIWTGTQREPIRPSFVRELCNRLRALREHFRAVNRAAREKVQVPEIPHDIRFGLAMGDVYELGRTDARQREYVGICINLASRLQKYCWPGIGFAAARVQMSPDVRTKDGYIRVIAKAIDGFPREYVILDNEEYQSLDSDVRSQYFERVR